MSTEQVIDNPYVGPRTFTYEQRSVFFGREREARDLLARVVSERLLLFYAQSGAGKSSLLRTRLIPQLQEEEGFAVLPIGRVSGELQEGVSQVGNIYLYNLMSSLDQSDISPRRLAQLPLKRFLENLTSEDGLHWYYIEPAQTDTVDHELEESLTLIADDDVATILDDETEQAVEQLTTDLSEPVEVAAPVSRQNNVALEQRYVLIIDQFEEIITAHAHRRDERENFFRQLNQVLIDDPNLWVVLTLREDYVAALDPYAHLMADKLRARFHMERMGVAAALAAVKGPAAVAGHPFAEGVAEALVDNLRRVKSVELDDDRLGDYVEPVQLQVVCYQLWQGLQNGRFAQLGDSGEPISYSDLERSGNVDNALADFYEAALTVALDGQDARITERQLRSWFDTELLTDAGTRSTVFRGDEETAGISNLVVDTLQNQFLLRTELRAGGAWIELVHDRFVEPIQQANRTWLETQSPLLRAAQSWDEAGRPESFLLSAQQLNALQTGTSDELSDPLVADLIAASRAEAEMRAEREAAERQRQELEQAQAILKEADARRLAESLRAQEAEERQREQAEAAKQLRRRSRLLGLLGLLSTIAMIAAVWFAFRSDSERQNAVTAFETASVSQIAAEAAVTAAAQAQVAAAIEAAKAQEEIEAERNSALQLAAELQLLLSTPTPSKTSLPSAQTPNSSVVAETVVLLPTATPNLEATATIQSILANINQVVSRATVAAQPTPTPQAEASQTLYAYPPFIEMSIFEAPDVNAERIERIRAPEKVRVNEFITEWAEVETNAGNIGWIRSGLYVYEGDQNLLPLDLRYRLVSNRSDLPFIEAKVVSVDNQDSYALLSNPENGDSDFRSISVDEDVIILQTGSGIELYGSDIWYFVNVIDPNNDEAIVQGWLPFRALAPTNCKSIVTSTEHDDLCVVIPDIAVSINDAPSTNSNSIATVRAPTKLPVTDVTDDFWIGVELSDGREGWVYGYIVFFEGDKSGLPADLHSLVLTNRTDLPFVYGEVMEFGGASYDNNFYSEPDDDSAGFLRIESGTQVTLLEKKNGVNRYGSGIWYLVALPDPNGTNQLLKGYMPSEILEPVGTEIPTNTVTTEALQPGDRVRINALVNARRSPGYINKPANDIVSQWNEGKTGNLIEGPIVQDALFWWRVESDGEDGWIPTHSPNGELLISQLQN